MEPKLGRLTLYLKYFTLKGTLTVKDPLMNEQEDWCTFKATRNK